MSSEWSYELLLLQVDYEEMLEIMKGISILLPILPDERRTPSALLRSGGLQSMKKK